MKKERATMTQVSGLTRLPTDTGSQVKPADGHYGAKTCLSIRRRSFDVSKRWRWTTLAADSSAVARQLGWK